MILTGGAPTIVLVEGESDAGAIRALIRRVIFDTDASPVHVVAAGGVTNFSRVLVEQLQLHPDARVLGMYDLAEEWHVRRALRFTGTPVAAGASVESAGFFACIADLEDELIRALGPTAVEEIIKEQSELPSFRRFQAMPEHRASPLHMQLHRFLGTRATRKIRLAKRLVEALALGGLPRPLAQIARRIGAANVA